MSIIKRSSNPRRLIGAAILIAALAPVTVSLLEGSGDGRLNVLLIIGDDITIDDFGAYGHPHIRTPNLDTLARNGLRANNAYATTSSCSPSRASIITGRYPHNTGAPELHMALPEGQVLFPSLLRESGYYTAAMGKWHLGDYARKAFDDIGDSRPSGAELWVETLARRPKDKPFFMWFASHDAHRGWQADPVAPPHGPEDVVVPPYMADTPGTREDLAHYMDEVQRLDRYVGDVVAELERQGVLDNTLLIFVGEDGRPFPRDKSTLYDSGVKTPFIVHWPEGLKGSGMVSNALISTIDIAATVLELAGIERSETVQGVSFSRLFQDPGAQIREYAFMEMNWHTQFFHQRAVRWENYVYMRNAVPEYRHLMMAKINRRYPSWMDLMAAKEAGELTSAQRELFRRPRPEEELFDVVSDPHQLSDLAAIEDHQAALQHLRQVMDRWVAETGDTIPAPDRRTPDRYHRETGATTGVAFNPPRDDIPGKSAGAATINHPGPIGGDRRK